MKNFFLIERKLAMETIEEELEGKHNKSPLETEYIQILKDIYQYMKIDTSLYENKGLIYYIFK